jgi:transposase
MRGRKLKGLHTEEELKVLYLKCHDAREKIRWHALWLLKCDIKIVEVAQLIGRSEYTIRTWRDWYNEGGPERVKGKPLPGRPSNLTQNQYEKTRIIG